jgi:hypothetical protein
MKLIAAAEEKRKVNLAIFHNQGDMEVSPSKA